MGNAPSEPHEGGHSAENDLFENATVPVLFLHMNFCACRQHNEEHMKPFCDVKCYDIFIDMDGGSVLSIACSGFALECLRFPVVGICLSSLSRSE